MQTSDASIALVMACTQAATELAWAHSVGQRWHVYDEFWRIATFGKLVARLDGGRRISRKTGAADMIVSHRGTDSMRGDEQAQAGRERPDGQLRHQGHLPAARRLRHRGRRRGRHAGHGRRCCCPP